MCRERDLDGRVRLSGATEHSSGGDPDRRYVAKRPIDACHLVGMASIRSRAGMKRCGMRHTRTFHLDCDDPLPGTDKGEVEYEITRHDWEHAHATGG